MEQSIKKSVTDMLIHIGEDPAREGLIDTPDRIIRSWDHIFSGYQTDPKSLITDFSSDGYNQMVLLKDIEFYSMCEHHMLPFFGKAHIAYIPTDRVIGVSKLARILDCFSRRMQIQERIGEQVVELLSTELHAEGAACVLEAQHLCMKMRGVEKQDAVMVTSSLRGVFLTDQSTRSEFLGLIK
jgi:GTP cyclohydrolase I